MLVKATLLVPFSTGSRSVLLQRVTTWDCTLLGHIDRLEFYDFEVC